MMLLSVKGQNQTFLYISKYQNVSIKIVSKPCEIIFKRKVGQKHRSIYNTQQLALVVERTLLAKMKLHIRMLLVLLSKHRRGG